MILRILAVSRVLDEEDIIEPMVRHHAALVDHHVVLDNGSTDRTVEILEALAAEGLPLTILRRPASHAAEPQFNTALYRWAVGQEGADWVVFLDADEFVDARGIGDLRSYLATVPAEQPSLSVDLVDYAAPTTATVMEPNVLRRLCRRGRQPIGVPKVLVRGSIGAGRVTVSAGNHTIRIDGQPHVSPPQDAFVLAHYPSRSPYHWAAKAAVGWLKVLAAGDAARGTALHYAEAFARLKRDPAEWIAEASAELEAAMSSADLVVDPLAYLGREPVYTRTVDYGWRAVGLVLSAMEQIAAELGGTVDADPGLHARREAAITDFLVVSRSRPGAAPVIPYGCVVGGSWRRATDPGFAALLGAGWSVVESWGIWGTGEVHALRLHFRSLDRAAEIDLDVTASLPGSRRRLLVDVAVLGMTLERWEFTREINRAVRTLRLPARLIAAGKRAITVELRPREVGSPAELDPGSTDTRMLGVGLHQLRQRLV